MKGRGEKRREGRSADFIYYSSPLMGRSLTVEGNPTDSEDNDNKEHHLCYANFDSFISNLNEKSHWIHAKNKEGENEFS